MWTHPGKKTIFMGWNSVNGPNGMCGRSAMGPPPIRPPRVQRLVDDLNVLYKAEPALWRDDFDQYGFQWIDCNDNRHSVISFMRRERQWHLARGGGQLHPQSHSHYRVGVLAGFYANLFNTDAARYGGSNLGNMGGKHSEEWDPWL